MPMPSYPVLCYEPGCGQPAVYKIAARWSDGITSELKTYGLTCERCLPAWYRRSLKKQKDCRRASNEVLDPPGIYRLRKARLDTELERLKELEAEIGASELS
jgi:hypothetical protein